VTTETGPYCILPEKVLRFVYKKGGIMETLDVYSARDLRISSGNLFKEASQGRFSLITKHGKPAILAVPFDAKLLELGLNKDLAVSLCEKGLISLSKAAKIASLPLEEFLDLLAEAGVAAVDYPVEDLEKEMKLTI
jgi:predicted HTH domain antitoxin